MTAALLESTSVESGHRALFDLLTGAAADHRLIDHPPEGRTDLASALRGHHVRQAAKCIVVRVKLDGKTVRYALTVVAGDRRVDFDAVARLFGGRRAGFADGPTAERLTGCVSGSIIPFSFHRDLFLVVDPELLAHEEIYFNAGRLDQSVALATVDYLELAAPLVEEVAVRQIPSGEREFDSPAGSRSHLADQC
ncbi:Prolyl-tRNA synthetase [Kitasatospora sp. MMS16-BH015]|uniref:YbaK/EbsC family protein n=1 Tax=Kitasatospora sp. MMS16-BH015 TaxID=2018025 RepID=UPI000CA12394|nr:YbaK/EbsC family protein [Kitasatospora sp. MMS16-BH015]AUG78214.1 Prolyl-tRNA synthetase [Kitasatospora sp. MMS16-BH015]